MKVGLTLPSFQDDPEVVISVARTAEDAGVDGVFAYDHLFRVTADGRPRPALECTTMLGALAAETGTITIGSLVARATLRPPATLAVALDTVHRIAGDRLVAAIGAGDRESRPEMEAFGLGFGTVRARVEAVRATVAATRGHGYPVWVGGSAAHVGVVARTADGWNRWGASPERFAAELAHVRPGPGLTVSWGGLVVLAASDDAARDAAHRLGAPPGTLVGGPATLVGGLREYEAAGADWVIVAPVDSSNPANAARLGAEVAPLLRR